MTETVSLQALLEPIGDNQTVMKDVRGWFCFCRKSFSDILFCPASLPGCLLESKKENNCMASKKPNTSKAVTGARAVAQRAKLETQAQARHTAAQQETARTPSQKSSSSKQGQKKLLAN